MAMKQEHPSQRRWSLLDLHESLLHLILARVHVYSLPSCALVCKTWSLIITRSPTFARLHASLHNTSHTWLTLFTWPSTNSMFFYDMLLNRCVSMRDLDLLDESLINTARISFEQREQLRQVWRILFNEKLLATSEGLVLLRSCNDLIVTNIVTRKSKPLPSPNLQLCHIAFVGITYMWATMSYQVLLCGLPQTPANTDAQGTLSTCVYNSLTHCWTNVKSTLAGAGECKKFVRPQTCVWLEGNFYCVMGRALYLFNLENLEWCSVYSSLSKGHYQPHERAQVRLPSKLIHFHCLWQHKGELRIAGSVRTEESKLVTQSWRMPPSLETGCSVLQWKTFGRLLLIDSKAFDWLGHGNTLCFSIMDEDIDGRMYNWAANTRKMHFCVHDLTQGNWKIVKSIPRKDVDRQVRLPTNLAIQPCPFTSP